MRRRRASSAKPLWLRYWPLAALPLVGLVFYLLAPMLAPFVTAAVLAYILQPLARGLQRRGCPLALAVMAVMLLTVLAVVALVLVVVPLFVQQLTALYGHFPELLAWLRVSAVPWLVAHIGLDPSFGIDHIKAWLMEHSEEASQVLRNLLPSLTSRGLALLAFAANLILLPVLLFYFLRDWDAMLARLDTWLPRPWRGKVHEVLGEVDEVLGQYLRGQLAVMLIMALFYSLGLWLAGLQSALPIGVVAGLLVFIPYLGATIGILLATLAAALQFGDLLALLPVWGVFIVGQLVEGFVVTPRLVGERIGLHPVAVIFALMAFGQLLGFLGVLLALPLAAMLLVGLRHFREQYFASHLYQP